jgi:hypothetical protein
MAARSRLHDWGGFRVLWKLLKLTEFKSLLDEHLEAPRRRLGGHQDHRVD